MSSARFNCSRIALQNEVDCDWYLICKNTIQLENNYNRVGVVAKESGKDARTHCAHHVYHDAAHPSALEIPIVDQATT